MDGLDIVVVVRCSANGGGRLQRYVLTVIAEYDFTTRHPWWCKTLNTYVQEARNAAIKAQGHSASAGEGDLKATRAGFNK